MIFDKTEINKDFRPFMEKNKAHWDELVAIHTKSEFYNLAGFLQGKTSLTSLELEEIGQLVNGKSVLHLQCHFGMDTLSLERLGATVTGVDFSEKAITFAKKLAQEVGSQATFYCANIYDLPQMLDQTFDIVYTSYGVLCWLPDLERWAKVISHFLNPGGFFYIIDGHPFSTLFDNEGEVTDLQLAYPYFQGSTPFKFENEGSYADRAEHITNKVTYEWIHTVGGIINPLLQAGLQLEYFHEFPVASWRVYPFLVELGNKLWTFKEKPAPIPLTFSLKANKPIRK